LHFLNVLTKLSRIQFYQESGGILNENLFIRLVDIVEKLRSSDGCPWDRKQTHDSLKPYLLEESYEVLETIDKKDFKGLREELGDLLLQSILHAQLAHEKDLFTIWDVIDTLINKLVRRHPHVFDNMEIDTAEEQIVNWENIKNKEGKKSILDGVPKSSPALLRAFRIQQKASIVGFDWKEITPVLDKIKEEIDELQEVIDSKNKKRIEEELGDLLFAIVNLSRFIKVNPEDALRMAIEKFIYRFNSMETIIKAEGKEISDFTLEEMDVIWNQVKNNNN
jgi:tetrapyrrole methylase family protein/MazG family protein